MKRIWCLLLVLGSACNDREPAVCVTDTACSADAPFCSNGSCVGCRTDTDCSNHEICDANACTVFGPKDEANATNGHGTWSFIDGVGEFEGFCTADNDCPFGEICNPLTAGCLSQDQLGPDCPNARCPEGSLCIAESQRCTPAPRCRISDDSVTHHCQTSAEAVCDIATGLCTMVTTPDCTVGDALAVCPTPTTSNECPLGTHCNYLGRCVGCTCDDDCEADTRCVSGTCLASGTCFRATDCPAGESCDRTQNRCTNRCADDAQCPAGMFCDLATAVCLNFSQRSCAPDNAEPNETADAASQLSALTPTTTLSLCASSVDWYAFDLAPNTSLRVTPTVRSDMSIRATGFSIDALSAVSEQIWSPFGSEPVQLFSPTGGSFLIRAERVGGEGFYELTPQVEVLATCGDVLEETTRDDLVTQAVVTNRLGVATPCTLTAGTLSDTHIVQCGGGVLCPGDVDTFLVDAPAGGTLTVALQGVTTSNAHLVVYGPFTQDPSVLTSSDVESQAAPSTGGNLHVTLATEAGQIRAVKVFLAQPGTSTYILDVRFVARE